jgi:parvulin-like peptidyl-prolyl isomerase
MTTKFPVCALLFLALNLSAQVASHAPTGVKPAMAPMAPTAPMAAPMVISDKPVAKVNGAVLTDRDLLREMYSIFPYAKQHGGKFPKAEEASIRKGALEMIIFEELVYQAAVKTKLTIPETRISQALAQYKGSFHSPDEYQQYLKIEMQGSEQRVRDQIRRSMMIDRYLKLEVEDKSAVTPQEVRAFYDKNAAKFTQPERFAFQSISIMPPIKPTPDQAAEAKKLAAAALEQAKKTKSAEEFGLLAEKISQDDFHVDFGRHKPTARKELPPQVVAALDHMKLGGVSGLIQIESAYTIIRLNEHIPAGKQSFASVKASVATDMQKAKYEHLRSGLDKKLRANAKVEIMQGS